MKSNITKESLVTVVLIILLGILLNPFHVWMPSMMQIFVLGAIVVLFGLFASFILREKAGDEREGQHRMLAGRVAFLAGSAILMLGIIIQSTMGIIDNWLVVALVVMVIAKIGTRIYSDLKY